LETFKSVFFNVKGNFLISESLGFFFFFFFQFTFSIDFHIRDACDIT